MSFLFISPPRESCYNERRHLSEYKFQDRPDSVEFPGVLAAQRLSCALLQERLRRILSRQVLNCFSFLDALLFRDWLF